MAKAGTFQKGEDPRRNTQGRGPSIPATIAAQAKNDREGTFKALQRLRDQAEDERVQLEAARTLAAYSDGKPAESQPEKADADPADAPMTDRELELLRAPGTVHPIKPEEK